MRGFKFIALSGAGWVFDFAMFTIGVKVLGAPEGPANFVSATIAAMTVYAVARLLIFKPQKETFRSFAIYFAYTELNIVFWSVLISVLTGIVAGTGVTEIAVAAMLSKIAVTPLSVVSNFFVAKRLSRRATTMQETKP